MIKKTITIFSLRSEAVISGERASFDLLDSLLEESEFEIVRSRDTTLPTRGCLANLRRLLDLYHISSSQVSDILIIKLPTSSQLPLAVALTRRWQSRVVFWVDGLNWSMLPLHMTVKLLFSETVLTLSRIIFNNRLWVRLVRKKELELIVSSDVQKSDLCGLISADSRVHVIPNGTRIGWGKSIPKRNFDSTCSKPRCLNLGYIGHSYLTKGVKDFLIALSLVEKTPYSFRANFALTTLGDACVATQAINLGYSVYGEVNKADFYNKIDLLVIPYWTDWGTNVFPNVLLESMECGVPVVTSDLPITRELFGSDGLAIFVPPNNPNILAETLIGVLAGNIPLPAPEALRTNFLERFSHGLLRKYWLSVLA